MSKFDEIQARFMDGSSEKLPQTDAQSPTSGQESPIDDGFSPIDIGRADSFKQLDMRIGRDGIDPKALDDANARIEDLQDRVADLTMAINSRPNQDTSDLVGLAAAGIAINSASAAKMARNNLGRGKALAFTTFGALLGAGVTYGIIRDRLNEYAAAALACEAPAFEDIVPNNDQATGLPVTPTTLAASPTSQGFQNPVGFEAVSQQQAGNLRIQGSANSVEQYDDGSYVESDTIFEWKLLAVSPAHDSYSVQLLQQTNTGYLPDSTMQKYIAEGEYTQQELLAFLVTNNIVDPNATAAFIKIVGSDGEELTKMNVGVPLG